MSGCSSDLEMAWLFTVSIFLISDGDSVFNRSPILRTGAREVRTFGAGSRNPTREKRIGNGHKGYNRLSAIGISWGRRPNQQKEPIKFGVTTVKELVLFKVNQIMSMSIVSIVTIGIPEGISNMGHCNFIVLGTVPRHCPNCSLVLSIFWQGGDMRWMCCRKSKPKRRTRNMV